MTKNLHELAKEYAQNVIDQETYRKYRQVLIQGICAGTIEIETREYLAPLETFSEDLNETTENMITQIMEPAITSQETSEKPQTKPESRPAPKPGDLSSGIFNQKNILVGMGAIILVTIIALAILLIPTTEDSSTTKTSIQEVQQTTAGQNLIIDFIQQKNWTRDNMESFVASWQLLSDPEHNAADASL